MKLSIIIPAYNVENFIEECLDSILSQDINDYEMIIVDDGSTDSTGKICDAYAAKYSQCHVYHKENGGLSHSRNYGIKYAQGEYLMFVDSDDFLTKNSLKHIVNILDGNIDIVVFNYQTFCNRIIKPHCHNLSIFDDKIMNGKEYLKAALEQNHGYNWCAVLYCIRRNYYNKNNYMFDEGKVYEDVRLMYRVIINALSVRVVDRDIYIYRHRAGSITTMHTLKTLMDYFYVAETNINEILNLENIEDVKPILLHNMSCMYYFVLMLYFTYKANERKQLFKKLKEDIYITKYSLYEPQKIIRRTIKLIGIRPTAYILYLIAKIIKKI